MKDCCRITALEVKQEMVAENLKSKIDAQYRVLFLVAAFVGAMAAVVTLFLKGHI